MVHRHTCRQNIHTQKIKTNRSKNTSKSTNTPSFPEYHCLFLLHVTGSYIEANLTFTHLHDLLFCELIKMGNCHKCEDISITTDKKKKKVSSRSLYLQSAQPWEISSRSYCLFRILFINGILQYMVFDISLLSTV